MPDIIIAFILSDNTYKVYACNYALLIASRHLLIKLY